jgi:hypothetical protein
MLRKHRGISARPDCRSRRDNVFDALRSDSGKLETFLIVLSSSGWEDASEGDAMQEYRIFILGPDGHIMDRYEFRAPDDNAAKEHAKQMVDGHDIELWERARKIAELRSESSPLPNRRE